jgi:hypothetical protein
MPLQLEDFGKTLIHAWVPIVKVVIAWPNLPTVLQQAILAIAANV